MDYKYIEQLLERYFDCQTSLEEEQILRSFFSQKDVPACFKAYAPLFVYEQNAAKESLGDDFDEKVLAIVEKPSVKARVVRFRTRLAPLFKAAAVVAIVLTISNTAEHSFMKETPEIVGESVPTFADTYIKKEDIRSAIKVIDRTQAEAKSVADTLMTVPAEKVDEIHTE